jgi:hypothetical protein
VAINSPIVVWGVPVASDGWREYNLGVYLEARAIGWTDPSTGIFFTVNTRYGDRVRDAITAKSIGRLLKGLLKNAGKAANPL